MKSVEKQYAEEKGMLRTSISKQKTAVETDLSALKNLLTSLFHCSPSFCRSDGVFVVRLY